MKFWWRLANWYPNLHSYGLWKGWPCFSPRSRWQRPLEKNNCSPHLEVAFRPCVSGDLQGGSKSLWVLFERDVTCKGFIICVSPLSSQSQHTVCPLYKQCLKDDGIILNNKKCCIVFGKHTQYMYQLRVVHEENVAFFVPSQSQSKLLSDGPISVDRPIYRVHSTLILSKHSNLLEIITVVWWCEH